MSRQMSTEHTMSFTRRIFRGKEVISAVRTTFLINTEGKIVKVWDNVKAAGHAEKVLSELKLLKENNM